MALCHPILSQLPVGGLSGSDYESAGSFGLSVTGFLSTGTPEFGWRANGFAIVSSQPNVT